MVLKVLDSGSRRNGYILHGETESLLVEVGCRLSEVKKALDYDLSSIVGAVISHEHNDHSGYINSYLKAGILCMAPRETFEAKEVKDLRYLARAVEPGNGYMAGGFKIIPFELEHDVRCFGYLIEHEEMGRLAFITDTPACDYEFPGLNHIMIEANHAKDIIEDNIISGRLSAAMRPRLLKSHMELQTTKDTLSKWVMDGVNNIILIHLSAGNSDQQRFVNEVRETTGKPVYAAERGLAISLDINPY